MKAFLKRHRLAAFFVLAFVLSWYPWIIALMQRRISGPNPLGPLVAGIIVTAIVYGRPGLREFFGRMIRGRVGAKWYVILFLTPVLICLSAIGITLLFADRSEVSPFSFEKLKEIPERFIFILLFVGLGEEPGWRGFALPHLQVRHSALMASLILAPIWTLWHLPLIGNEFQAPLVPQFVVSVFGGTFFLTWIFNGSKGSVLLPMLFHSTINTVGAGLLFPLFTGTALIILWWVYSVIWFGLGLLVLVLDRSSQPVRPLATQAAR